MPRGGARPGAGRKKKPDELKVLEGTWRKDRDGDRPPSVAPDGLVEFPEPPKHLTPAQRDLWNDLRRHCGGWVKPGDWLAVNGVVSIFERLCLTQRTYEARRGKKNPMSLDAVVNLEVKLWRELRGYLAILGLSPADRAKVAPKAPAAAKKASKWDGIISGVR